MWHWPTDSASLRHRTPTRCWRCRPTRTPSPRCGRTLVRSQPCRPARASTREHGPKRTWLPLPHVAPTARWRICWRLTTSPIPFGHMMSAATPTAPLRSSSPANTAPSSSWPVPHGFPAGTTGSTHRTSVRGISPSHRRPSSPEMPSSAPTARSTSPSCTRPTRIRN